MPLHLTRKLKQKLKIAQTINNHNYATGNVSKVVQSRATKYTNTNTLSMVVPVYTLVDRPQTKETLVYALLDTQSDTCFIASKVSNIIQPPGQDKRITISTLNGKTTNSIRKFQDIKLRGYSTQGVTTINAYEQESIPCQCDQIPTNIHGQQMKHLANIAKDLPPPLDIPIGLLI